MSPPWVAKRACKGATAIARQTADRCVGGRRCNRGSVTTGGLRPPLLFGRVRPPTKLRLLRCTNAYAPRAAGVSPPCGADALAKALLHLLGRPPTGVLAHSVAVALP